ncbi:MAG: hypothetical protein KIG95_03895 [Comamonas sp.]|nr:hypothetical protein [Comamonas sp.]
MNQNIVTRLANLIDIDGTEVLLTELGGQTIHIPRLDTRAKDALELEHLPSTQHPAP